MGAFDRGVVVAFLVFNDFRFEVLENFSSIDLLHQMGRRREDRMAAARRSAFMLGAAILQ